MFQLTPLETGFFIIFFIAACLGGYFVMQERKLWKQRLLDLNNNNIRYGNTSYQVAQLENADGIRALFKSPQSRFIEALPSYFLLIGLIGTFLGLMMALSKMGNPQDKQEVISYIGSKFKTSIFGVCFNILFRLLTDIWGYKHLSAQYFQNLDVRIKYQRDIAESNKFQGMIEFIKAGLNVPVEAIKLEVDRWGTRHKDILDALKDIITPVQTIQGETSQWNTRNTAITGKIGELLDLERGQKTGERLETLIGHAKTLNSEISGFTKTIPELVRQLSTTTGQFTTSAGAFKTATEQFKSDTDKALKKMTAIIEKNTELSQDFARSTKDIFEGPDGMKKRLENIQNALVGAVNGLNDTLEDKMKELNATVDAMKEVNIRLSGIQTQLTVKLGNIDQSSKVLAEQVRSVTGHAEALQSEMFGKSGEEGQIQRSFKSSVGNLVNPHADPKEHVLVQINEQLKGLTNKLSATDQDTKKSPVNQKPDKSASEPVNIPNPQNQKNNKRLKRSVINKPPGK